MADEITRDHYRAAVTAHEINRLYCLALGDASQPHWLDAPAWQQESILSGVRQIIEDPTITPEQSHAAWLSSKLADGWVYGETKDPDKKTHPCCVPYAQLPTAQQTKDVLFGAVVRGVLADAKLSSPAN